jgi:hypothetical protein
MRTYLKEKQRFRSRKLRLTTVRDPPRWPRVTPPSVKVGTKFRRKVAVAQSVKFACGLKATEFILFHVSGSQVNFASSQYVLWLCNFNPEFCIAKTQLSILDHLEYSSSVLERPCHENRDISERLPHCITRRSAHPHKDSIDRTFGYSLPWNRRHSQDPGMFAAVFNQKTSIWRWSQTRGAMCSLQACPVIRLSRPVLNGITTERLVSYTSREATLLNQVTYKRSTASCLIFRHHRFQNIKGWWSVIKREQTGTHFHVPWE